MARISYHIEEALKDLFRESNIKNVSESTNEVYHRLTPNSLIYYKDGKLFHLSFFNEIQDKPYKETVIFEMEKGNEVDYSKDISNLIKKGIVKNDIIFKTIDLTITLNKFNLPKIIKNGKVVYEIIESQQWMELFIKELLSTIPIESKLIKRNQ